MACVAEPFIGAKLYGRVAASARKHLTVGATLGMALLAEES